MKNNIGLHFILFAGMALLTLYSNAQKSVRSNLVNSNVKVANSESLHLLDSVGTIRESKVDLASNDAWLYFDNVRPSIVMRDYLKFITIKGKKAQAGAAGNCRVAIFKQGAVVIPQSEQFDALQVFDSKSFKGQSAMFRPFLYYTNKADKDFPADMVRPLQLENQISSFRLKKGYMLTLATKPDGLGYSRIFIADTADLLVPQLPPDLLKKIAYIRIFPWDWPSKKGWCGSRGKFTVESTGKNKQENEIDLTQSTWFYSWGARDPVNSDAEFVPMKWGYGGSLKSIDSIKYATHLLGYNEPNRPDQSNMTVDQALEEWPELMKSGLRLGSPSVSDNSKLDSWLYKFLDECDKRNYRVDYVTVHAYWGAQQMATPKAWYEKLREIHLRTHRPIWLTEWNNGANWTKEGWPSDTKAQQQKQLRDLRQIINILDTASFIERYSIYNWVEDKRAVIIDSSVYREENGKKQVVKILDQKLTPAGWFYRNNHPDKAYNPKYQYVGNWHLAGVAPSLDMKYENGQLALNWMIDVDGKMLDHFNVESSENRGGFVTLKEVDPVLSNNSNGKRYYFVAPINKEVKDVSFRVVAKTGKGNEGDSSVSNEMGYRFIGNRANEIYYDNVYIPHNWQFNFFKEKVNDRPVIITGIPTNNNKFPQMPQIKESNKEYFQMKLGSWNKIDPSEYRNQDSVGILVLPKIGNYDFGGLNVESKTIDQVGSSWKTVKFDNKFKEIPVVFVTVVNDKLEDSLLAIRIRNITKDGFEICHENGDDKSFSAVQIFAVSQGQGEVNGNKVKVGRINELQNFFHPASIDITGFQHPIIFGFIQSTNNLMPSDLRIKGQEGSELKIFMEELKSRALKDMKTEVLGYMIIDQRK